MKNLLAMLKERPVFILLGLGAVAVLYLVARRSSGSGSSGPGPAPALYSGGGGGGGMTPGSVDPISAAQAQEALREQAAKFDESTQLDYLTQSSGLTNANADAIAARNNRAALDSLAIQQKSALDSYNFLFAPLANTPVSGYSGGFAVSQPTDRLPPTGSGVYTVGYQRATGLTNARVNVA